MEIKKYPKLDLESRKTTYVLTGLAGTLAILFIALEWSSTSRRSNNLIGRTMIDSEEEEMFVTIQTTTPPPPPPPPLPDIVEQWNVKEDDAIIEDFDFEPVDDQDASIDIVNLNLDYGPNEEEDPDDMIVVPIAEQQPEFPGGESALMAFIKKNLRYPAFAAENGIQGRVVLQFIVEKDGSIGGIEVIRTPAEELSKEAIRVAQNMPKWKAGKQRGKPVRVKFVLPITFRLS